MDYGDENIENMTEVWKPIPGYVGIYEVSNLGNVRSLPRDVPDSRGYMQHRIGRTLVPQPTAKGYLRVGLSKDGITVHPLVSRLVCQTFISEYSEELECDHINGNHADNRLSNLQCISHKKNNQKAWLDGTNDKQKKPITLKNMTNGSVFRFESRRAASRELNIPRSSIKWAEQHNKQLRGYIIV